MSKTGTYILIGGAVLVGGYFIAKKLAPPSTTPSNPLGTVVNGVKDIVGLLTGGGKKTTGGTGTTAGDLKDIVTGWLPGFGDTKSPPGTPREFGDGTGGNKMYGGATGSRLVGDGDAAISDSLGQDRANRNTTLPTDAFTSEDKFIGGGISYSHYTPDPIRGLFS